MANLVLDSAPRTNLDLLRGNKLIELANDRFAPKLSDAEVEVLRVSASFADPYLRRPDPVDKDQWGPRPPVRAELVRWLATDSIASPFIASKGVRAFGVTIPGGFDFYGCRSLYPLIFWQCNIEGDIDLQSAETQDFFVIDCAVKGFAAADSDSGGNGDLKVVGGIDGARVVVNGSFDIKGSSFYSGVSLIGGKIRGDVNCHGTRLFLRAENQPAQDAPPGAVPKKKLDSISDWALLAGGARVEGRVFFLEGFKSYGDMSLAGAEIGGDLAFSGVEVGDEVGCANLQLSGDFFWNGITRSANRVGQSLEVKLDLTGATIRNLRDDKMSWPSKSRLLLNGLVYTGIESALTAGERINWLQRQSFDSGIEPQPWIQLAAHLDSKGDHRGAKHVLYELKRLGAHGEEKDQVQWKPGLFSDLRDIFASLHFLMNPARSRRSGFQPFAIAFAWLEEVPLRIGWSICLVLLTGTLIFDHAFHQGAFAPTDEKFYAMARAETHEPVAYPDFNPFIYTLENGVPLVKLGQDEKWAPNQNYSSKQWLTNYWFLMCVRWGLILSGWLQATVLAAALSGIFKE
jgi:hypothetical protein